MAASRASSERAVHLVTGEPSQGCFKSREKCVRMFYQRRVYVWLIDCMMRI